MDFAEQGIYSYAKKNPEHDKDSKNPKYIMLKPLSAGLDTAEGVYHKYADMSVDLKEFGVKGGITKEWSFDMHERGYTAKMTDGHAMSVDLFGRCKESPYYKGFDSRVTKAFGDDSWLESFGPNMTAKRKNALKKLEEKQSEFAEAKAESDKTGGTPVKKGLVKRERIR